MKPKTAIIILLIIMVCVALFFGYLYVKQQVDIDSDISDKNVKTGEDKLIVEPAELDLKMHYMENVKAYLYNPKLGKKEDVTNQAEWTTSDASVVFVGNKAVKGQVVAKDKEGETEVVVNYNNKTVKILVRVIRPKLEVECAPRTEDRKFIVKIGEKIEWVSSYTEPGSPNYTYEWSGTDGLEGVGAIAEIVYTTPGIKKAKIFTEDTAGNTAEGECEIGIIE